VRDNYRGSCKNSTDQFKKLGNTVVEYIEMQNITAKERRFNEIIEFAINRFFSADKNSATTNFFAATGWEMI
jgi:hypothetical protein